MTEQGGSSRVNGVSRGPCRRRWQRASGHSQAVGDMQGGNSGVDRALEERRDGVGAEGSAESGWQTMAQIGNQRGGGQRNRPKSCKRLAVSWKQFCPTELAGLQNTKGAGEGNAETMAKDSSLGNGVIKKVGHGMVGMKNKAWRSRRW
jgi:hypothetical protein